MIRDATLADAARIAEIYNQAVLKTTGTFDIEPRSLAAQEAWIQAHGPRHPVVLDVDDGAVRGWASLSPWSDRAAYADTAELSVYIDESHRGRRIGTRLVSTLLERARGLGYHTVVSRVSDGNPLSVRLHETAGFVTVGRMREVGRKFGRYLDVLVMQLML